jgi:hypothetical protein
MFRFFQCLRNLSSCDRLTLPTYLNLWSNLYLSWDRRGRFYMVVGFTTTYAISAYHH